MAEFINKYIFGTAVPAALILCGIFYTMLLRGFHIRHPLKILRALTKKNTNSGISPFRAVTLALAGTLGVGNIVGVSAAISLGGFGAIFWMWVSAFCAMLLKYAEIVLAMRHRRYENGIPHGSAMYYIKDFFLSHSMPRLAAAISGIFALLCILNAISMGGMIQSNAIAESMDGVFGISPIVCGILLTILCAVLCFGGRDIMAKFTEILVPLMTLGYIIISVAVIFFRRDMLPEALLSIVREAFAPEPALGGILGFLLSRSLRFGTMRGLISNEAGCGTAPTAHSASNSSSPAEQGFWGIFEVFTDTIVLCSMTALVVILNYDSLKYRGSWIMLTIDAYSVTLGNFASVFLGIAVLCFGFATIVCWANYGIEAVYYLKKSKTAKNLFIFIYCAATLAGTLASPNSIWSIADFAIGAMTLINLTVLCFMSREVKEETDLYFASKGKKHKKETVLEDRKQAK